MTSRTLLLALSLLLALTLAPWIVAGESMLRLRSGREVPLSDGKLRFEEAQILLQEAEEWLTQGRLNLVRDNCQTILARGEAGFAPAVTSIMTRLETIERSSLVELKNGQTVKGTLRVRFRRDHLGLLGRQEIPLWQLKRIGAEYYINYSQVTRTFYVLTLLNIQFRDAPPIQTRLTEEIAIKVEEQGGAVRRVKLGYPYVLLREEKMGEKFPRMIQDRVSQVVIYPALYPDDPPQSVRERERQ